MSKVWMGQPQNAHHELDVVESVGQQVVLVLDQSDGVQPLAHGLHGAAGPYEGVEGQTFEEGVAVHAVAAAVRLRQLALPHHVVTGKVAVEGARHASEGVFWQRKRGGEGGVGWGGGGEGG